LLRGFAATLPLIARVDDAKREIDRDIFWSRIVDQHKHSAAAEKPFFRRESRLQILRERENFAGTVRRNARPARWPEAS
jgi:hypothetical protein